MTRKRSEVIVIKALKARPRIDTLKNDVGSRVGRWGRWVYLALLAIFTLGLLNYSFGANVFLNAEGIVLRPQFTVAAPYDAQVKRIWVRAGESVDAGTPIAQIESAPMTRSIAELLAHQTTLKSRIAQLDGRLTIVKRVLPLTLKAEREAKGFVEGMEKLKEMSVANPGRLYETRMEHLKASERALSLAAEQTALEEEVSENRSALAEAEQVYEQLKAIYGKGEIVAPMSGTVGPEVATTGEVVVVGKKLLEIFSGAPYVLAYLPESYLFELHKGQRVRVASGFSSSIAVIAEILPVADSLPVGFRSSFRARERSQLVRIDLPEDAGFALQQKVSVGACLVESCETAFAIAQRVAGHVRTSVLTSLAASAAFLKPTRHNALNTSRNDPPPAAMPTESNAERLRFGWRAQ